MTLTTYLAFAIFCVATSLFFCLINYHTYSEYREMIQSTMIRCILVAPAIVIPVFIEDTIVKSLIGTISFVASSILLYLSYEIYSKGCPYRIIISEIMLAFSWGIISLRLLLYAEL